MRQVTRRLAVLAGAVALMLGVQAAKLEDFKVKVTSVNKGIQASYRSAEDLVALWEQAGPEGRHRALGPGGLREMVLEADTRGGELVQEGAGRALVPVAAQAIGAKGVDEQEEDVEFVVFGQPREVLDVSAAPGVSAQAELRERERNEKGEHDDRSDELVHWGGSFIQGAEILSRLDRTSIEG